ncbi:MAG TPA: oligosaccharide flippase family protein [Solirubrobacteraceae bacterium]|nr:oligosaccharide flippase family protein [Solirubrobacteraceae bacterium]
MTSAEESEARPEAEGSLARDTLLVFVGQAVGNVGLLVAVVILARSLGPDGRGSMAFIMVGALVGARLVKVGLGEAARVMAARRPDDQALILVNFLLFTLGASALGALVLVSALLLAPGPHPASLEDQHIILMGICMVCSSTVDESFLLGASRFRHLAIGLAFCGWSYVVALAVVAAGPGLTVSSAAVAWSAAAALSALAFNAPPLLRLGFARPDIGLLRESLHFGLRAWPGSVAQTLNARVDQLIIGVIASASTLGIYAIAVNVAELLLYIPHAISRSLTPRVATGVHAEATDRTLHVFRLTMIVTVASGGVALAAGPLLLPLVFGEAFRPSVGPFMWLVPGALGVSAMLIFVPALLGTADPGRSSLGPMLSLVTGIVLVLLLVPGLDATGASVAATVSLTLGGVTAVLLFRRRQRFAWRLLWPRMSDLRELAALPGALARRAAP